MTTCSCAWPRCASRIPARPLVLYGHSLGGLIALGYVLSDRDRPLPDLLVLSAPGLDDNLAGWKRPMAGLLTSVVPKMQLANGVPDGGRSRDPGVDAASAADPLCSDKSTVRFGAEAFAEQDRVRPPLAGRDSHARADLRPPRLGRPASSRVAASAILEGKGNVTRHVHAGLRHECHHEPEHEAMSSPRWSRGSGRCARRRLRPGATNLRRRGVDSAHNRISASGERATR